MRWLALAVVLAIAAPAVAQDAGPAPARDPAEAFRAATQVLAGGDLEAAQAAFEAVAALDPAGPWADDALSEAATVAERRGDLGAARRLWRRVLDEHPSSRQSRRARAKVAAIEAAIGEGGAWLAVAEEHERIVRDAVGDKDPTEDVRALEALVASHPDYPRVHDARMWIGETWLRLGHADRAAAVFADARARATRPEDRWRAGKAHADALAAGGDLDGAERLYRAMLGEGDELADRALEGALDDVRRMRTRQRLVLAAWIVLAAAGLLFLFSLGRAAGGARPALRALVPPPLEVWFFLPVAITLVAVALSGNFLVERAVRTILLGGLVVTWLGGASLDAARRRGRLAPAVVFVHVVAAIAAIAATSYLAVMNDRLIDMIRETWSHGHEGR